MPGREQKPKGQGGRGVRRLLGLLGVGGMLLFAACNQSGTPSNSGVSEGNAGTNPYAGGVSYPWSDRLESATPGSDPYANGRSYPWVGPQGSGSLGRLAATSTFLSDLTWTSATNAWGPAEKDLSNGEQGAGDGHPLTIGGQVYAKGLGVHAGSELQYTLGGSCTLFTASVGIDDEVGNNGSVNFQLFNGSTLLYDSGVLRGVDSAKAVSVNITGVQTLRLVVTNGGDNIDYDHADWANAAVSCESSSPPAGTTQISSLGWQSASNGWGPVEKNQSNGEQGAGDGKPLTIGGVVYASGLGVHAASQVSYALGGNCSVFTASVGLDDEVGNNGSVNFQLFNGSTLLYDSGVLRGVDSAKAVSVNITGVQTLRLVVTNGGDNIDYDHADWADAKITCGPTDTTPPAAPTALTGSGTASGVSLDWADNTESDLAGYAVSRSASAAGPFTVLNTTLLTVSAYLDASAPAGTTLYYQVVAVDRSGNVSAAASVRVTSASGAAPSLSVTNLAALPSNTRLVFSRIEHPNPMLPDVVHDTNGLRLSNAGPGVLHVMALTLQNTGTGTYTGSSAPLAWEINPAPTLPLDIAAGSSVDITVHFIGKGASSDYGLPTRFDGQLNIVSNDAAHSPLPITLAGLWQTQSEDNVEPSVEQIVSVFGYTTALTTGGQDISALHGLVTPQSSDEVISSYWQQLIPGQPVQVSEIAAYHGQGNTSQMGRFNKGNRSSVFNLFTHNYLDGQTLLPHASGSSAYAAASFTPTSSTATPPTFGFLVDNAESTDPTQNNQQPDKSVGCPGPCGNHVRLFRLRGPDGQVVAGQYVVLMDYSGINYDFNDNMFVITNIKPASVLVNVGGPQFTDPSGQVWMPDKDTTNNYAYFTPSDARAEPTTPYNGLIGNTTNPVLYRTYRSYLNSGTTLTFNVPLDDGTYTVKLHMIDLYWQTAGQRIFNVYLQNSGTPSILNEDIIAKVGPKNALVETLPGVQVTGGKLVVTLSAGNDFGALSGIEIVR